MGGRCRIAIANCTEICGGFTERPNYTVYRAQLCSSPVIYHGQENYACVLSTIHFTQLIDINILQSERSSYNEIT